MINLNITKLGRIIYNLAIMVLGIMSLTISDSMVDALPYILGVIVLVDALHKLVEVFLSLAKVRVGFFYSLVCVGLGVAILGVNVDYDVLFYLVASYFIVNFINNLLFFIDAYKSNKLLKKQCSEQLYKKYKTNFIKSSSIDACYAIVCFVSAILLLVFANSFDVAFYVVGSALVALAINRIIFVLVLDRIMRKTNEIRSELRKEMEKNKTTN